MIPVPTRQQLAWQNDEMAMFLHFGVNTFTDREWGEGTEDPALFNPSALDARQWARTAKEAGFRLLILTAKHHDGFCLWPSRYTAHSVKHSPWRNGKGDVVRELVDACREFGLKFGFYLSPWDRHEPTYGDSPAYNRHFVHQLEELLTGYGEVTEVWFDGANGEGPNGKKQEYDWPAFYATVRRHQPHALIAISGPDIRWVGNEDGFAHETEWSVQSPNPVFHPGRTSEVWWPSECDVSIRPGWFYHASEDAQVKTLDQLVEIYFASAGRNSNLLLNVPPDRRGLLADPDVSRLRELRSWLDRAFAHELAHRRPASASSAAASHPASRAVDGDPRTYWSPADNTPGASIEIDLAADTTFNTVLLQEHIAQGQRVQAYHIDALTSAGWREVARGTTIGHKKLDRFAPVTAGRLRVTIDQAKETPQIAQVGVYRIAKGG